MEYIRDSKSLEAALEDVARNSRKSTRSLSIIFMLAACLFLMFCYSILIQRKKLDVAKSDLGKSRAVLRDVYSDLRKTRSILVNSRNDGHAASEAISFIDGTAARLDDASQLIERASWNIPGKSSNSVSSSIWRVVIGSFQGNPAGLQNAINFARLQPSEKCSQVWLTPTHNYYAVTLGDTTDQQAAADFARQLRQDTKYSDAYAQFGRPGEAWKIKLSSTACDNGANSSK